MLPSRETNGHNFFKKPGPTKGCEADGDDTFEFHRRQGISLLVVYFLHVFQEVSMLITHTKMECCYQT
jgi:hypothetical protein